jgi:hypothetical protein
MKKVTLQIVGFALMALGIQGVIRLLSNEDTGLLAWLHVDTSLLLAINVIIACSGIYLLAWAQKKAK